MVPVPVRVADWLPVFVLEGDAVTESDAPNDRDADAEPVRLGVVLALDVNDPVGVCVLVGVGVAVGDGVIVAVGEMVGVVVPVDAGVATTTPLRAIWSQHTCWLAVWLHVPPMPAYAVLLVPNANINRQHSRGFCAAVASSATAVTEAPVVVPAIGAPTSTHAPDVLTCSCWNLMAEPLEYWNQFSMMVL